MADLLLQVKDVSKTFPGVKALDHVNLQIGYGEVHGLIGENGAGKSTIIKIIAGIYEPDEGQVTFMGKTCLARKHTPVALARHQRDLPGAVSGSAHEGIRKHHAGL